MVTATVVVVVVVAVAGARYSLCSLIRGVNIVSERVSKSRLVFVVIQGVQLVKAIAVFQVSTQSGYPSPFPSL